MCGDQVPYVKKTVTGLLISDVFGDKSRLVLIRKGLYFFPRLSFSIIMKGFNDKNCDIRLIWAIYMWLTPVPQH